MTCTIMQTTLKAVSAIINKYKWQLLFSVSVNTLYQGQS